MECHACDQQIAMHEPTGCYVCCNFECERFGMLQLFPDVIDAYAQAYAQQDIQTEKKGG